MTPDLIASLMGGLFGAVIGSLIIAVASSWSQRKEFDHRVRMEKEYSLYAQLWEQLYELRRALGCLIEDLSTSGSVDHGQEVNGLFNSYQNCVRKGEPFMHESVFASAREITGIVRSIVSDVEKIEQLSEESRPRPREKIEDTIELLKDDIAKRFTRIDELFQAVCKSIRQRITPTG